MKYNMMWVGRHEGLLRDVARGCAYGDAESLRRGAKILSAFIPDGSIIVPMPSHIGYATTMLSLCRNLKSVTGGCRIWNGLRCEPHESSHVVKLRNGTPPKFGMYLRGKPPKECVYVIDNTIATGMTASMALEVLPFASVLAITKG